VSWHGIGSGRRGLEALLDAIEQLQGAAVPASVLEREVLPARVDDYTPAMLDTLMSAGEVVWVGLEPLGEHDGRVALYLTDHVGRLRPPFAPRPELEGRAGDIVEYLREHGASFFAAIHDGTGGGFPNETVDALWSLVWQGLVTNDTVQPLRAYTRTEDARAAKRHRGTPFRSRRLVPPRAEGRWSLVEPARQVASRDRGPATEWAAAMAQQLLARHGVITRETVAAESIAGGFSAVYQVLKGDGRMRDASAADISWPARRGAVCNAAALDLLRSMRDAPEESRTVVMAATDPATRTAPWSNGLISPVRNRPRRATTGPRADARRRRTRGARRRTCGRVPAPRERELLLFSARCRTVALARWPRGCPDAAAPGGHTRRRRGMLIAEINGARRQRIRRRGCLSKRDLRRRRWDSGTH
jgi:ATP-dependent Lhr-like helicase